MSRGEPQANANARRLIAHLRELEQEKPGHGRSIQGISDRLKWSYNKTRDTILWCRNQMADSEYMISCFKDGRTWYYKIPNAVEAREYRMIRGLDYARRGGHLLLMVRKEAAKFGVTRETRRSAAGYTEVLRWMGEMGIDEAEEILARALRDLSSLNGQSA